MFFKNAPIVVILLLIVMAAVSVVYIGGIAGLAEHVFRPADFHY